MIGPEIVECPQGVWTKIASVATYGIVDLIQPGYNYYQTYRRTGQEAPMDPIGSEIPEGSVRMFTQVNQETIDSSFPIDVYILSQVLDGKIKAPGKVRVSI